MSTEVYCNKYIEIDQIIKERIQLMITQVNENRSNHLENIKKLQENRSFMFKQLNIHLMFISRRFTLSKSGMYCVIIEFIKLGIYNFEDAQKLIELHAPKNDEHTMRTFNAWEQYITDNKWSVTYNGITFKNTR